MGNAEYMGKKHQRRMAIVKLFLACVLVGCAIAHETEYYNLENDIAAPPGETYGDVEMLQEDAGSKMKEDVVYRISWNTQYDTDSTKTGSKGAFKITIDGPAGATTGEKKLVSHPGYNCGAASDPACFPDITGKVLADDDASMDCGCDPSNEAYDEVAAKWHPAGAGSRRCHHLKGHYHRRCCLQRLVDSRVPEGQHERHAVWPRKRHLLHGHWQKDQQGQAIHC